MASGGTAGSNLTCENHGDRRVDQVCGECGRPVCGDCSKRVTDATLDDYANDGAKRALIGVAFVGVSVFLLDQLPQVIWLALGDLAGSNLYPLSGLKPATLLVGLALLGTLRVRSGDGGFDLSEFQLLTRRSNPRVVCESCWDGSKRLQRLLSRTFKLLAVVLIVYGLYQSVAALFFRWLWVSGLGAAVWILREDLKLAVLELTG
jgi:hypothetical protein